MNWIAAGPYGIVSGCGLYTISQARAGQGWVFSAYYKSRGPIAREECGDSAAERKVAAAAAKRACVEHSKEGTDER